MDLKQVEILNNLEKYLPAFKGYSQAGPPLGDTLLVQDTKISDLEAGAEGTSVQVQLTSSSHAQSSLGIFEAGTRFKSVLIEILEPFNSNAFLTVGTDSGVNLLASSEYSDPFDPFLYTITPELLITEQIELKAFLSLEGSTTGKLNLIVNYLRD